MVSGWFSKPENTWGSLSPKREAKNAGREKPLAPYPTIQTGLFLPQTLHQYHKETSIHPVYSVRFAGLVLSLPLSLGLSLALALSLA
jgi:hypothetical protein